MTKPFSPAQKHRILVHNGALVVQDGAFVPIAQVRFATLSLHRRFKLAREWGCAVKCACGCGVWARLQDVDFDHIKDHVMGGPTAIANGRPLRRQPCHAAKSAASQAVTGKVTRVRRKLSVTRRRDAEPSPATTAKRSAWPTRSFTSSKIKRRIASRPMQSRPFPQRHEATT